MSKNNENVLRGQKPARKEKKKPARKREKESLVKALMDTSVFVWRVISLIN